MKLYINWDSAISIGDNARCVSCKSAIWSVEVYWNGAYGDEHTDYDLDFACRRCNPEFICEDLGRLV